MLKKLKPAKVHQLGSPEIPHWMKLMENKIISFDPQIKNEFKGFVGCLGLFKKKLLVQDFSSFGRLFWRKNRIFLLHRDRSRSVEATNERVSSRTNKNFERVNKNEAENDFLCVGVVVVGVGVVVVVVGVGRRQAKGKNIGIEISS